MPAAEAGDMPALIAEEAAGSQHAHRAPPVSWHYRQNCQRIRHCYRRCLSDQRLFLQAMNTSPGHRFLFRCQYRNCPSPNGLNIKLMAAADTDASVNRPSSGYFICGRGAVVTFQRLAPSINCLIAPQRRHSSSSPSRSVSAFLYRICSWLAYVGLSAPSPGISLARIRYRFNTGHDSRRHGGNSGAAGACV